MKLKKLARNINYLLQAVVIYPLFSILFLIPLDAAAAISAFMLRKIGPLTYFNKIAKANLELVFPEKTDKEKNAILNGMWDNLGRVLAEYVHLNSFLGKYKNRITVTNPEILEEHLTPQNGVFFTAAHIANWEMANIIAAKYNVRLNVVYRAPNNFFLEPLFRLRQNKAFGELIPKSRYGGKRILHLLKQGEFIGILADQKMNSGILLDFMGHPAMTLDSIAVFSLMRKSKIMPTQIKRTKGSHFEVTFYPIIEAKDTGNRDEDIRKIMEQINTIIGEWIKENPEQWLWIHDRWGLKKKGLIKK